MKSSGQPIQDLKETPVWRWLIYILVFGGAVLFLGRYDTKLLWILPGAIILCGIWFLALLHFSFNSRTFLKGYLVLVRIVIVVTFAVLCWKTIILVKKMTSDHKQMEMHNQRVHSITDSVGSE
jgi:hypothetical protein